MLYLGLDCGNSRVEGWLVDPAGRLLARGVGLTLQEALAPCLEAQEGRPTTTLAAAPAGLPLPWKACPREHALFAGALGGQAGLVVHGGERAEVLALDRTGLLRTARAAGEAGLEPLRRRALDLAEDPARGAGRRLRDRLERRQGLLEAVYELASWPGPDPDLRGLLVAQARRLVELARSAHGRLLPSPALCGTWTGELLRPPLLELFQQEVSRYLPEVRWRPPLLPPAAGAVLLARAGGAGRDGLRALLRQRQALKRFLEGLVHGLG